ncbi:chromosome transmission fidelity [Chrysochromulina tobinii]|uniref:Chromosome transmission fidelity n=1 Tax=Chrysochromulina tobinii TaxID=1460289 RepID=A0A0M0K980_9EUKA|nr:chromosome transmission fidelity [Chrysochromulina tobinii]|eukprot:KOO35359.1 chromosome transmission fidelity [Chrysochromulina sp. CCMP291]
MDEADFMESFDDDLALEAELEAELQAESAAALAVDDEDIPEEFDATSTMRPVEVRQQRQAVVPMEEERAPIAEASAPASAMEQEEQELEEATAPQHDREVVRTFSVSLENGRELPLCLLAPRDHSHFAAARTGNLLSQPISVLRDTLDRQASAAERAATQASERLFALGDADLKEVVPDSAGCTAPPPSQLWVDKYAPQRFMELLSDERVNRQVLAWIKGWDEHVFRGQPSTAKSVGMGKTTLAHVVAKHAGYRPVEINASDERSAKVLKQRIAEATDMQSVFSDHRPPLIILDEIDGAMGGSEGTSAIHELLKLANMTARQSKGSTDDADGEGGAKGAKGSKGLQRPVICICNDVYAPALRPLRAVAECIEFRAASNSQLLTRLKHVCRVEKLHAEPSMLDALAQLAHQDVRTCLNTLQFVRGRSSTLSEAVLASRADVARVLEGVHENYLNVSYTDPQLLRTAEAAEALSVLDLRTQAAYSKGHFALEAYASAAVVEVHMACAVPHLREKISFPKAGREQQKRCEQQQAIVRGWQGGMSPALHAAYPRTALIVDVLSPLLTILTPPIKPGATHLLASDERRVLSSLVDVMLAFGLSYQQRSTDEGGYAYRLEPPLAELLPSIEPLHEPDAKPAAPSASAEEGTGAVPLAPKAAQVAMAPKEKRDMFGRVVPVAKGTKRGAGAVVGTPEEVFPIRFKYQEGVTDAVRRVVRVRDLL